MKHKKDMFGTANKDCNQENKSNKNKNHHVFFSPQNRMREINVHIKDMKHIMYTDQTGQFPIVSSQRNRYIMVLCKTDENLILVELIRNRTSGEMYKAYE